MPQISLNVGLHEDNIPHITHEPRIGANFRPLDIIIPTIWKAQLIRHSVPPERAQQPSDEVVFQKEVEKRVQECCGVTACLAVVTLAVGDMISAPDQRKIAGATLKCNSTECPLIDPPESGDREPLVPAPNPPALAAEVSLN